MVLEVQGLGSFPSMISNRGRAWKGLGIGPRKGLMAFEESTPSCGAENKQDVVGVKSRGILILNVHVRGS